MPKKLLILDVDETLLYAGEEVISDLRVGPFGVIKRPFLFEFLKGVSELFDLAVWSSGTDTYVTHVIREVCPHELKFVWARDKCTRKYTEDCEFIYIKDLKKTKYDLAHVIMVDDTPSKLQRNYGNLVRVRPFYGDQNDAELKELLPYLATLVDVEDVRKIEKRGWKTSVQSADPS